MRQSLIAIIISVLISWGLFSVLSPSPAGVGDQSAYDRVTSTGVLRCGYFEEAPFTIMDPNTKAKSGIAVELTERIAKDNGWKVEWVAPINIPTFVEDVYAGKFDAICSSVFVLPRGGRMVYSDPYADIAVLGYTTPEKAKNIDITKTIIAGIDGEGTSKMAKAKYPNAQFMMLSQSSGLADRFSSVLSGKADVVFASKGEFSQFDKSNPNALVPVQGLEPLGTIQIALGLSAREQALQDVMNITVNGMKQSGELDKLIKKYDPQGTISVP